eukprot:2564211-Pyramimonas_sp.AAC.1
MVVPGGSPRPEADGICRRSHGRRPPLPCRSLPCGRPRGASPWRPAGGTSCPRPARGHGRDRVPVPEG